ncbi:MAG: type 4a pilus biogenesis protein PilO [PVC group bacterium]
MNYTQKVLSILFGVILLLVLFRFAFYDPVSGKLERLQEEAKALDRQIAEIQGKQAALPGVQAEISAAREKLERLEVQYPRTIELVYQTITDAARKAELKISKRDTAEKKVEDELSALRVYEIDIIAYCPYRVLGEFLNSIATSPMFIFITGLTITEDQNAAVRKEGSSDLRVEMQLTTYLSRINGS